VLVAGWSLIVERVNCTRGNRLLAATRKAGELRPLEDGSFKTA
jgi:hypothetical protein